MGDGAKRDRLDQALASWPEPSVADALVDRTLARVGHDAPAALALNDDALFAAPLPAARGEGTRNEETGPESREQTRARDRANLQELARMGGAGPASASVPAARPAHPQWEEDSGVVRFDGAAETKPSASAPAVVASAESRRAEVPPSVTPASPGKISSKLPAAAPARPRSSWIWVGGGAVAVAAGVFGIFLGSPRSDAMPPTALAQASAAVSATPNAPASVAAAASDRGVNPLDLPAVPQGAGTAVATLHSAGGGAARPAVAPAAPAPSAPPPEARPPVAAAPAAASSGASLEALMQQAAGPAAPRATAADAPAVAPAPAAGSVPLKPSQGAVQGAMGAAMPAARACLGPDDAISRVNVVFQSDGSVASVSVTGGAAGTPAEACIRAALMKARLTPFAQPTYSVPATVRPN